MWERLLRILYLPTLPVLGSQLREHHAGVVRRRVEEILWRHSYENDTVVTAIPVFEREFEQQERPFVRRARSEGREVA